jgi:hypothetical protein
MIAEITHLSFELSNICRFDPEIEASEEAATDSRKRRLASLDGLTLSPTTAQHLNQAARAIFLHLVKSRD